jgi:hypothetical protein
MKNRLSAALLGALLLIGGTPGPARAQDPDFLTLGAGAFDYNDDATAGVISLDYLSAKRLLFLQPLGGFMVTFDGAVYGHAGLGLDIFFGRRIVATPSFSVGLYGQGDGKDLGHVVEFRSAIQLAYRFDDRSRLGVVLHHLSNAGLDDTNPGANSLLLTYSRPFGRSSSRHARRARPRSRSRR